ncbi:MAG: sigma-70 family RNA polymerase sigma factor [Candidatus Latescibacterota bacterium]
MGEGDEILVRRVLQGDRQAFADLVERYTALVHGIALEKVRRPELAEDLVQEVFVRAYQDLPRLREPGAFGPWLGRVTGNLALDWLRRRQVHLQAVAASVPGFGLPEPLQPDEILEQGEVARAVWEALDGLDPALRRVAVLFHLEGCTLRQIARFLGVPRRTVRWRLYRARRALHRELEELVFREAACTPARRRRLCERVLAGLPLAFAFPAPSRSACLGRWGRWVAAGTGGVGALALLGVLSSRPHTQWPVAGGATPYGAGVPVRGGLPTICQGLKRRQVPAGAAGSGRRGYGS